MTRLERLLRECESRGGISTWEKLRLCVLPELCERLPSVARFGPRDRIFRIDKYELSAENEILARGRAGATELRVEIRQLRFDGLEGEDREWLELYAYLADSS